MSRGLKRKGGKVIGTRSVFAKTWRIWSWLAFLGIFFAAVAIMSLSRQKTVHSCLSQAANNEARRQFGSGEISEDQLVAALTCDIHVGRNDTTVSSNELNHSVSHLINKVAANTLFGLLQSSSRSTSALLLSSDPHLVTFDDLKAAGLLLFGVDTKGSTQAYERAAALNPNDMDVLIHLGQLYHRQSLYKKSEEIYKQIILKDNQLSKWRSSAILDIGIDYQDEANFPGAVSSYEQAAELCTRIGRSLCAARAMANLGEMDMEEYDRTNKPSFLDQARNLTMKSLKIFQDLQQGDDVANNLQVLSMVDSRTHALPLARREAEESLNAFISFGDAEGVVLARGTLGDVALDQGDLRAAQASYQAMGREASQHNMQNEVLVSAFSQGLVEAARHHHTQACQFYAKALAAWAQQGIDSLERHKAEEVAHQEHCEGNV